MNKLEVGEKYLRVSILGGKPIAVFKNKNKQGDQPDYKGDGVAIWITEKKPSNTVYKARVENLGL